MPSVIFGLCTCLALGVEGHDLETKLPGLASQVLDGPLAGSFFRADSGHELCGGGWATGRPIAMAREQWYAWELFVN